MFIRTSSENAKLVVGAIPSRPRAMTVPLSIIPSPAGVSGINISAVINGWSKKNSR